ncbi:autophagy-related protein 13-domain-containing protein [Massariosphaeria phaeospora]|uniref:Autophagy-related protein 13 n=1 Tax=Massariosphaeria phaeospora TaxID=100035 RepID=A0A7C8MPW2_9PLEO|nr:autophagy-related protein 13-domain-containing protein [Massariosphaeria phaeospora]
MHPQSRPSPRTAAAANNLQTNPTRTNNQRDSYYPYSNRSSPFSDMASYSDRGTDDGEGELMTRTERVSDADQRKVNQVIQNFFTKAALTIISSRMMLPQSFNQNSDLRQNKWFNVVLDETDVLTEDLMEWKTMDAMLGQHPSLCIEIYLDIKALEDKQSLVIHDDQGKRWDVAVALNVPLESTSRPPSRVGKSTQLVLERWKIQVGDKSSVQPSELTDPLPNVYKKAVVLFRSLYAYLRFLPTFKYCKSIAKQPANHPSLKLNYRISNGDFKSPRPDTLSIPLYTSSESVTDVQEFAPSNSPVGPLAISVEYRTNCEFSVDDSESLLSSQFMGLDDNYFDQPNRDVGQVPGSLPVNKLHAQGTPEVGQAYGSMSTFHQVAPPTGTSPMSALRAARDMPSSSPIDSPPQKLPPNHRTAQGSKSSLRSADAPSYQRRTSVSFQPFKAGSLSSSPGPGSMIPPSPVGSLGRPSSSVGRATTPSALNQPRNRTSLTALPQTALRAPSSLPNEAAVTSSASSSPKPAPITRYSSSFGHRRSRFSSGGGSKTEDENNSSGKGSVTSSQQPGSDMLNEGEGASSGSIKTDDENISDFLKLLEQKKDLKSFSRNDNASRDAAMRKTTAQLSKYQQRRGDHSAFSDSLSSSTMLHRSSSSSSRQLTSVPAMIAGTSVSTASSPGKPISPHTPHTPAIPSRLSANSIIEYEPRRSRSRPSHTSRGQETVDVQEHSDGEEQGSNAIDIPTSPRPWNYPRRSSSVAQQNRTMEDEPDLYGLRSASVPPEEVDRQRGLQRKAATNLTSSGLFAQTELLASASRDDQLPGALSTQDSRDDMPRPLSTSDLPAKRGTYSGSSRGRGGFSSSSSTSLTTGGTSSTERQSRYSFANRHASLDDDEPLLFQMSEIGAGSRRSLEEGRGGSSTGSAGKRGPWLR